MSEIVDFPFPAITSYDLNTDTGNAFNPARGFEHDQMVNFAESRWLLTISNASLTMEQTGVAQAFLSRLAKGARFRFIPPMRKRPLGWHKSATRGWLANPSVEASVHAITVASNTVEVAGLAAGATMRPGDFFSYPATGETEHRLYVIEDLAPVSAGGNNRAILRVGPTPKAAALGTVVRFDDPRGVFIADQDSIRKAMALVARPRPGVLSLTAMSAG
jgi:hypothetical protein